MIEVVFVGRKPASAYVVAVAVALHRADWAKLKARYVKCWMLSGKNACKTEETLPKVAENA